MKETMLLEIQRLIAQKNFLTAQANRELDLGGWNMDYATEQNCIDSAIDRLMEAVRDC